MGEGEGGRLRVGDMGWGGGGGEGGWKKGGDETGGRGRSVN